MAQSILELIIRTSSQGTGGKAAAAELKELKGTVGEVTSGFLGLNLGTLTAAGAVVALSDGVKQAADFAIQAVQSYQAYGEEMRGLAAITGTGTEQTSRMVQAFDDLGVSAETVGSVMSTAARKGFVATTENIAALMDKYNGLNDQQAKNKLLTDSLGKSGLELAKAFEMGSAAFKNAAASQESGMVINEKEMADLERMRVLQDNLSDTKTAYSNMLAKGLIPITLDYAKAIEKATTGEMSFLRIMTGGIPLEAAHQRTLREAAEASIGVVETGFLHAQMMTGTLTPATVESGNALKNYTQQVDLTAGAEAGLNSAMSWGVQNILAVNDATSNLEGATLRLKAAQEGSAKTVGGDYAAALAAAGISGDKLYKALAAIDTQTGTNLLPMQQYKDNISKMVDEYKRTSDVGAFTGAIASSKTAFKDIDDQVIDAQKQVDILQARLDAMVEKGYVINLSITGGSGGGGGGGGSGVVHEYSNTPSGKNKLFASGGSFTIPPGYNETFPIGPNGGASSGERVTITPKGKGPGGAMVQFTGNVIINNGMDLAAFEARLTQVMRMRG